MGQLQTTETTQRHQFNEHLLRCEVSTLVPPQPQASTVTPSGCVTYACYQQVGEGVKGLSPGDPVALEPGVPCWHCSAAREGRYNLDPDIQFFATPPVHGSLATFVDHPAELCYKLPPGVTLEEGAMCEPLSVGIHACRWVRTWDCVITNNLHPNATRSMVSIMVALCFFLPTRLIIILLSIPL